MARNSFVQIRVEDAERRELEARASAAGMALGAFMRARLFSPQLAPEHRQALQRIAESTGRGEEAVINNIVRDFIESDLTYRCEDGQ